MTESLLHDGRDQIIEDLVEILTRNARRLPDEENVAIRDYLKQKGITSTPLQETAEGHQPETPKFTANAHRAYTLTEIDALRSVSQNKYLYGTYGDRMTSGSQLGRSYQENEKDAHVETMVRSHMTMGVTAQDLIDHETATIRERQANMDARRAAHSENLGEG